MTRTTISQHDQANMFDLLTGFPDQMKTGWDNAIQSTLQTLDRDIHAIVVTGMGGSAIGGEIFANLYADTLSVPVYVNRDYILPDFIDEHTLVIACSYSGNTEETLSAMQAIQGRNPAVLCITSNGTLKKLAEKNQYNLIQVPGGQPPRTATGYLFFSILGALQQWGLVADQTSDFQETLGLITDMSTEFSGMDDAENRALALAKDLQGKLPIIYGAREPNSSLPTRWRNQFSENSKILAFGNLIPEMNHNEIVGWADSTSVLDKTHVILLRDSNNSDRIQARFDVTGQILREIDVPVTTLHAEGTSRLCRTFSLVYFADFVSYYLAVLTGVDPTPIKNIETLKNYLAQL